MDLVVGPDRRTADSVSERAEVVVRFAGDSGDGIQLIGAQLTQAVARSGHDLETFPDFPAEIRAPIGTVAGVSAFQIHFGGREIHGIGDHTDLLVALNPAALRTNLAGLAPGAILVLDLSSFGPRDLRKAGLERDPREDGSLAGFRTVAVDLAKLTARATEGQGLAERDRRRCRNFTALGLILWIFEQDVAWTLEWIERRFTTRPELGRANRSALLAGYRLGEIEELQLPRLRVAESPIAPGLYRAVTGHEALAFGLVDAARKSGRPLVFCSYPITPASALLHHLATMRHLGVTTFQAEDEIAAACAAIGASFAGSIGVTATSGPGMALKTEALGLAVATELPLVVVDAQRAGPSTGMPTKTEQSDLLQALWGRNGDTPLVVLAASTPADCFTMAREAVRLAIGHMTPVILLTDGFLANASGPWQIPTLADEPAWPASAPIDPADFVPFARDERLVRPWAAAGTKGLAHRLGGLERQAGAGTITYDAANHQAMTDARFAKIMKVADDIPEQVLEQGRAGAELVVVGWGSTRGPIFRAVERRRAAGDDVAQLHLRHLWPLPRNLGPLLRSFGQVLVAEMNRGQLCTLLRSELLVPAESLAKVQGQPFLAAEVEAAIVEQVGAGS